ncbi:MAG: cupredoxin domain-containing protein [Anaerolineales bacterium]|nr:cupredoxin domain-containing protein [Anaerolineales bacterium]MCB9435060.1 cupredoxin domain-containing protein [Ardenticatenaceae bacterium]
MKRFVLLAILGITAVFTTACGGESFSFDVTGNDNFVYEPAALAVKAGSQVTINFTAIGALPHNWLLVSTGIDPTTASDADALAGAVTGEIAGGTSKSITFTAPAAGTYTIVCTVPGHAEAGMRGTLTVEP